MKSILISIFLLFTSFTIKGQEIWSKTWDAGNTSMTNKIKSSHVINDTIYYVTFNVCDYDGETWNECNTIGMMNSQGLVLKETLENELSIIERTTKPWTILNDEIYFLDGKNGIENPTIEIKQYNKHILDSITTYNFSLGDSLDLIYGSAIIDYFDHFVCSGWYRITNTETWPDFLLWIDKSTMQIDTMISYPFNKRSIEAQFLFVDSDSLLTMYWSGINVGNGGTGGRGFMKIDRNMNIVSNYIDSLDLSTKHSYPHAACQLSNGNMVYKQEHNKDYQVFPISWASDYEILCVNSTGELKWRFNRPGYSPYGLGEKEITNITETANGDILACGYTRWHTNWLTKQETNQLEDTIPTFPDIDTIGLYYAPYILKLDGETGELIWQYSILEYDEYGNTLPYVMRQIHELSDGSIVGTGWSRIYNENGSYIKDNSWVIRLPADGCIEDENMECGFENYVPTSTSDPILVDMSDDKAFIFYPNPSSGVFKVLDQRSEFKRVNYTITNINGEVVDFKKNINLNQIDLTDYTSKLFFINIMNNKGEILQSETLTKW